MPKKKMILNLLHMGENLVSNDLLKKIHFKNYQMVQKKLQ